MTAFDIALIIAFILSLLALIIIFVKITSWSASALNLESMDVAYSRHQRWK